MKFSIPLTELIYKNSYRPHVMKALKIREGTDMINLNNDQPEFLFGLEFEGKSQEGSVPPEFDKIMYNAMCDSGASHNLMPRAIMEKLGLDITRPYKDLYSFDSSKVRFSGLIKEICVKLV